MKNDILPKRSFCFGTQYYRIVPMREDWERDIANIKSMGMDTIRYWAMWRWAEPRPGTYYFDDLHELVQIAARNDLDVILVINLDKVPWWLKEELDAPLINLDRERDYSEYVCWDHPEARRLGERFLLEVVSQLGEYENLQVWDVWNEPDKPECACEHCTRKYVAWLQGRFSSIEEFKERTYTMACEAWDQVRIPRSYWDTPEYLLYQEFRTWSIAEQVRWAYDVIKARLPQRSVTVHCHSDEHPFTFRWVKNNSEVGWDDWEMKRQVDFYITSVHDFYQGVGSYTDVENIGCVIANLETKRTMCGGQYWTTGLSGGASKIASLDLLTPVREKENLFSLWMCVAMEARGVVYWQYRVDRLLGPEGPGWGLASFDGGDTYRTLECREFIRAYRPHEESLMAARVKQPEVAVLYSLKSHIMNECHPHLNYVSAFEGISFALWINNIAFDVLNEQGGFSGYDIVYVPMGQCLPAKTVERLIDFAREGGHLVIEAASAAYDEYGILHTIIPGEGLSEAAGIVEKDVRYDEVCRFETSWGTLEGVGESRIVEVRDAEVLARFPNGEPAVTRKGCGQGAITYLATHVSSALRLRGGLDHARTLVDLIDASSEISVTPTCAINVRILENQDERFIFVFNQSNESTSAQIALPFEPGSVEEVYNGDNQYEVNGGDVKAKMAGRDLIVLKGI